MAQLDEGAPALVDSRYVSDLRRVLVRFDDEELLRHPRLAFAAGRLAALELDNDRATRFLAAATTSERTDPALVARAFWELGCLHLRHQKVEAAEITLALARGALGGAIGSSADLIHLEAVIADVRGEIEKARRGYRDAIGTAGALSQLTRVTALRNLAASLAHSKPYESVGLCELALALIEIDLLDERARPTINNVHAYALLCSGDLDAGAARAEAAYVEATDFGHELVARYARFNQAIALELKGEAPAALAILQELLAKTERESELYGWIQVRRAWLATKAGTLGPARALLAQVTEERRGHAHDEACATLEALIAFQDRNATRAAAMFEGLAEGYAARSDELTAFVLWLWCARASAVAGAARAAQTTLRTAGGLAAAHGFRISPNWWTADLAEFALTNADIATGEPFKGLLLVAGKLQAPAGLDVRIGRDGSLTVRGQRLTAERWRVGKTGSGVLQRTFRLFATSPSAGLSRDDLMDALWPDTDGDRALANLYGCLNDLRRFLAGVPGLRLTHDGVRYRLLAEDFVTFETANSPASTER